MKIKLGKTIFILCFILATKLWASEKIKAHISLPIEFKLLIHTYNDLTFSKAEKKIFLSKLNIIKSNISYLNKAELYILLKSEIYKSLLQHPPSDYNRNAPLPQFTSRKLEAKISSDFFQWIYHAFYSDYENIINRAAYKSLVIKLRSQTSLVIQEKVVLRKLEKVIPWLSFLKHYDKEITQIKLKEITLKLLQKIQYYTMLQKQYSKFHIDSTNTFIENFYTLNKIKVKKVKEIITKEILPIDDKPANINENLWKPREDGFDLFPKPNPNYIVPKDLPKPTDDWIFDL